MVERATPVWIMIFVRITYSRAHTATIVARVVRPAHLLGFSGGSRIRAGYDKIMGPP